MPPESTWFITKENWCEGFPKLLPRQALYEFRHVLYKQGITDRHYGSKDGSKAGADTYLLIRWQ